MLWPDFGELSFNPSLPTDEMEHTYICTCYQAGASLHQFLLPTYSVSALLLNLNQLITERNK